MIHELKATRNSHTATCCETFLCDQSLVFPTDALVKEYHRRNPHAQHEPMSREPNATPPLSFQFACRQLAHIQRGEILNVILSIQMYMTSRQSNNAYNKERATICNAAASAAASIMYANSRDANMHSQKSVQPI
jgi:hypothetical protein